MFDFTFGGTSIGDSPSYGRGGPTGGYKQDYTTLGALTPQQAQFNTQPEQSFDWDAMFRRYQESKQMQPQRQQQQYGGGDIYEQIKQGGALMDLGSVMNPLSKLMGSKKRPNFNLSGSPTTFDFNSGSYAQLDPSMFIG